VPEKDAKKVMIQLTGIRYKGRTVRCNDGDEGAKPTKPTKPTKPIKPKSSQTYKKEDWMQFLAPNSKKLKGEVPDFSEEGWAIRKPRKKK
jgi:ATP-dependent RNA helicase DeaD